MEVSDKLKNLLIHKKTGPEKLRLQRTSRIIFHEKILIEQFNTCPIWDYATTLALAARIGVPQAAVSKWNWSYRKQKGIVTKRIKKTPIPRECAKK